jgi:hypothetical protein
MRLYLLLQRRWVLAAVVARAALVSTLLAVSMQPLLLVRAQQLLKQLRHLEHSVVTRHVRWALYRVELAAVLLQLQHARYVAVMHAS